MSYSLIELYKIIYCPVTKKYKVIFNTINQEFKFSILLNSNYAKNIAMASENISSILLSQYELFINLLTELDLKLREVVIEKKTNNLNTVIQIDSLNSNNSFNLNSYIGDALILALKSFIPIKVAEELLIDDKKDDMNLSKKNEEYYNIPQNIMLDNTSHKNKILMLKTALNDSLIKENYESAAFFRDRIKILNRKK